MILYYSGCGNSRMVAETLSQALGERLVFIPEAARKGDFRFRLEAGEKVGFVWPVYCWAPPQLVLDYVSRLRIDTFDETPYVYTVMTYGDNAGLSEDVFRKALKAVGLHLDSVWGIQMPETYIQMSGMYLDTREGAAAKISAARKKLDEVALGIRSCAHVSDVVKGDSPWIKTAVVKPLFYKFMVTDRRWVLDDTCIGCGKCSKVCPLENISMEGNRPHWNGNCTTCNACYHSCPVNAIQFGSATRGKGQYRIEDFLE